MNTRAIGGFYEEAAIEYLKENGISIIDKNVTCGKIGEIDIIGIDQGQKYGDTLVFFEVKYRKDMRMGEPSEAVNVQKQLKIRKCAQYYLRFKNINKLIRFDVISICGDKIKWYKNAF